MSGRVRQAQDGPSEKISEYEVRHHLDARLGVPASSIFNVPRLPGTSSKGQEDANAKELLHAPSTSRLPSWRANAQLAKTRACISLHQLGVVHLKEQRFEGEARSREQVRGHEVGDAQVVPNRGV